VHVKLFGKFCQRLLGLDRR